MTVIGINNLDYEKKDGRRVKGISYILTEPFKSANAEGLDAINVFFSADTLETFAYRPKLGDEVDVSYNRFTRPYLIQPHIVIE